MGNAETLTNLKESAATLKRAKKCLIGAFALLVFNLIMCVVNLIRIYYGS